MDNLEQRLQVLERQFQRSRRFNQILVIAVLVIACVAGARRSTREQSKPSAPNPPQANESNPADTDRSPGENQFRTVEANQFVLLDQLGRSRATMVVTSGGPAIGLFDEQGKKRLELSQTSMASGLRLFGRDESPVVSLQLTNDPKSAHLEIKSSQGSSLTKAHGISVQDADDHGRLHLMLINGNFPMLGISQGGQNGPPSIEMTASEGSRSIKLHDDDGSPLFSVFSTDDGRTSLNMRHPDHQRSLQISAGPKNSDGPAIAFLAPAREDGTGGLLPHLRLGLDNDHKPYVRIVGSDGRAVFTAPTK